MVLRLLLATGVALAISVSGAQGLTPFPKPDSTTDVVSGKAAAFAGAWAIVRPTMAMGERDRDMAICTLPVRIEATGEAQIIYRQPRETRSGTQMTLRATNGGTLWTSEDGSESYFTFWVSKDGFYLYDKVPVTEADWGWPYVYRRCL